MKLCEDCKHYIPDNRHGVPGEYATCNVVVLHPVSKEWKKQYCEFARSARSECGKDAKLFESKNAVEEKQSSRIWWKPWRAE